jgi:hypothetical protein
MLWWRLMALRSFDWVYLMLWWRLMALQSFDWAYLRLWWRLMALQSFDWAYLMLWWRLIQKRIMYTELDIYFLSLLRGYLCFYYFTGSIPLLVDN